MGLDSTFVDLRRLADWFVAMPGTGRPSLQLDRMVRKLGPTCVPLLGRELCAPTPRRRDAARAALAQVAAGEQSGARARVVAELRRIAASDADDEGKVAALGLLAELGERGAARFADPLAIQRRSAIALAAQLDDAGEVAAAADLMIRQLDGSDMVQLVEVMAEAAPGPAQCLAAELCARLDLAPDVREHIAQVAARIELVAAPAPPRRVPRPTHVSVLVDAAARLVVVASRKVLGERRWRRWAVLIGAHGRIDDCFHEEHAGNDGDAAPLIASLVADGYQVASTDLEHARGLVAAAARQSADRRPELRSERPQNRLGDRPGDDAPGLGSAYYLGRDLLDLGEAHLGGRVHADPTSATLGRAVELLAEDAPARAQQLLARCDAQSPDVAAALAAALLAQGKPAEAIAHLERAIEAEPGWALHHWNLAAAHHQLDDRVACYHALRRFVTASAAPTGLYADPDQPRRVALAQRLIAELERTSRLAGTPLARPARRKRRTARPAAAPQR